MATLNLTAGELVIYTPFACAFTLRSKDVLFATLLLGDTGSFPVPGGPFVPGDTINISGTIAGGQTLRFGPAHFKGTSYAKVWYTGSLVFKAVPALAPANSANPVAIHTPFTVKGNLQAYLADPFLGNQGPAVFDVGITCKKSDATVILGPTYNLGGNKLGRDPRLWCYQFEG